MLPLREQKKLVSAALKARKLASARYSNFQVGAALLTAKGKTISGANVESASYGLTCCAERVALFKAVTDGEKNFVAVAVVSRGGVTPCGACRQLLSEYAPDAEVFVADVDHPSVIRRYTVKELLPAAFSHFEAS
jgi:cytidine deaminase